jgi:MscS family membrane protein
MEFISEAFEFASGKRLLGISLSQYALAFLAILASWILRRILHSVIIRALRRVAQRTRTDIDEALINAVEAPIGFAVILGGIYAAVAILQLPQEPVNLRQFADRILLAAFIVDATWLVMRVIDAFSAYLLSLTSRTDTALDDQLVPIIRKSLKTFVAILSFVFIIQNLGYSVASLVAGLGIGGLAIALAAQQTLSNFFGSITILIDRPFAAGDWIETSDLEGVVEEVGFRSTRVRTFGKTQVTVPNSVLANSVINNWSRMPIRRVKMTVGVTYESSAEQMEKAVEGVRELLRAHPEVHQDFFLVYFTDFGGSSLDIFVYYFTQTTVWAEYLRVRQEVNLQIMRLLESLGMEVAFPTRTVYLKQEDNEGA